MIFEKEVDKLINEWLEKLKLSCYWVWGESKLFFRKFKFCKQSDFFCIFSAHKNLELNPG